MSAIKDGGSTVTLKGKEYRLLFTLNALDELQTKFGGYDKLGEIFNKDNPDWVKDTKWLFTLLINEGLLEEDEKAQLMTETQVGRLIHLGNLKDIQQAIFASFAVAMAGDGESSGNDGENEEAGEVAAVQES